MQHHKTKLCFQVPETTFLQEKCSVSWARASQLKVGAYPGAWKHYRDFGDTLVSNTQDRSSKSAVTLALFSYLYLSSCVMHMSWDNAVQLVSCWPKGWGSHGSFTQLFFLSVFGDTIKKKTPQCQQNHI